jgi:hypothetical protein
MMGTKERSFQPLINVSTENLVPPDLAFLRELVTQRYVHIRHPSVNPVVVPKLWLVVSFEGLRSDRPARDRPP